ncbi:MAG: hypothetical protein HC880_17100 [Bacteroidia bacterium]|nr:hypothetical protein [Bacteroidia bacterium]
MLDKVAALFSLQPSWWLLVITILIGGLVGGLAALSGYSVRAIWKKAD